MTAMLNAVVRHALLIERVKTGLIADMSPTLRAVAGVIRHELARDGTPLGERTRGDLMALVKLIRARNLEHWDAWRTAFLAQAERLLEVDIMMQARAMVSVETVLTDEPLVTEAQALRYLRVQEEKEPGLWPVWWFTDRRSWVYVRESVIPAFGAPMVPALDALVTAAQDKVTAAILRGAADNAPMADIITSIVGTAGQGVTGVVPGIAVQAETVVRTIVQHVSAQAGAAVGSVVTEPVPVSGSTPKRTYMWISVLDSRTSEICQGRHRKVFEYGKGPLPPAHPRCRSRVLPIGKGELPELPDGTPVIDRAALSISGLKDSLKLILRGGYPD